MPSELGNNLKINIVLGRLALQVLARIALVAEAALVRLARHFLYPLAAFAHLGPRLFVGRGNDHAQQAAQRIDRDRSLTTLAFFK